MVTRRGLQPPALASNNVSATDLKRAEILMIKPTQTDSFAREMKLIQRPESLKKSCLYRLDPFIDNDGIIRVGGRLRQANQLYEESIQPSSLRTVTWPT